MRSKLGRALALSLLACLALPLLVGQVGNVALLPVPRQQFFDNNGYPLAGGYLYTCVAGASCTVATPGQTPALPQLTFSDAAGTVGNPDPLRLDSGGFLPLTYIAAQPYKIVLTDTNGVVQFTRDNVTDPGLLANVAINVKLFGATGNGSSDDTAAIGRACTAAGTATLIFPPAQYKIVTGNIATCQPGVTLQGYGAVFDITTAVAPIFAFNVGGSIQSGVSPTLIQGFRVGGARVNTSTYFARFDNVYSIKLRDIVTSGASLAVFNGSDFYSSVEGCYLGVTPASLPGILYSNGTYGALQAPFESHIDKTVFFTNQTAVEADAGEVDITNSTLDTFVQGVYVNGGRVSFRDGLVYLRGYAAFGISPIRAFLISSVYAASSTNIDNTLFQFVENTPANPVLTAIANASNNDLVISSDFNIATTGAGTPQSLILQNSATFTRVTWGKSRILSGSSNPNGGILNLTGSSQITGTMSGVTVNGNGAATVNWLVPGSTGTIANFSLTGSQMTGIANLNGFSSGAVLTGNYFASGGGTNISGSFASTAAVVVGNVFSPGLTVSGSVPSVCAYNYTYGCT